MILLSSYRGIIFYIIPMPFVALGRCEVCNAAVLLLGLNIGNRILTLQFHTEKKEK